MRATEIDIPFLRGWPLPELEASESKEDRGRVLVVAGSREVPGAALLAARAVLRAGAGKLHIATAADVAPAVANSMPEARVSGLPTTDAGEIADVSDAVLHAAESSAAVLSGPGMEVSEAAVNVARALAARAPASVFDAAAIPAASAGVGIITPHLGEMANLCNCTKEEIERSPGDIALEVARGRGVVVVLKSATTYVASPAGTLWVHRGGSVGLGTSGSGDVLAGVIAGLMAQGASTDQAAVWGVVLHGSAGKTLSARVGLVGYLAREIADEIPAARNRVRRER
jgi:hydroxyethylthiazole kinase-like uncharacterized protein yjeF